VPGHGEIEEFVALEAVGGEEVDGEVEQDDGQDGQDGRDGLELLELISRHFRLPL
jgi:hypothetical protein